MDARHQSTLDVLAAHAVAGVEDVVGVASDEVVVRVVVVRHQHDGVAAGEQLGRQRHPLGDHVELVRADMIVVDDDVGAERDEPAHDADGRRLPGVVGVLLVGDAEHEDAGAVDGLAAFVQPELHAPHDVPRHAAG